MRFKSKRVSRTRNRFAIFIQLVMFVFFIGCSNPSDSNQPNSPDSPDGDSSQKQGQTATNEKSTEKKPGPIVKANVNLAKESSQGRSTVKPSWNGPLPAGAAVVELTVKELVSQHAKDPKGFSKEHAEKWIDVTGEVLGFDAYQADYFDGSYCVSVSLRSGMDNVTIYMRDKQPWRRMDVGQTVTIRAALQPEAIPVFDHGQIVVTEGDLGVEVLSVNDLMKQFMADPEATKTKYSALNDKRIIVTGKLAQVNELSEFILVGKEGNRMLVDSTNMTVNGVPELGSTVKLLGISRFNMDDDGKLRFSLVRATRIDLLDPIEKK